VAYIETSSLDGEKNLKTKQAKEQSMRHFEREAIEFWSIVKCEQPNPKINEFEGTMTITEQIPLNAKQVLLCGATLRNTDWAIGVSVYTGVESKLRQNLKGRRFKRSQIEHKVNRNIAVILVVQSCLCLVAAVMGGVWVSKSYDEHWYLGEPEYSASVSGLLLYCTYFLLLNTMIPISLIISLEMIKLAQAFFMINDLGMYSELRNRPCKVSDSTLNEELGQIQHIFTDKTGTLTCNRMEFKFCTIGTYRFGDRRLMMDVDYSRTPVHTDDVLNYTFDDAEIKQAVEESISSKGQLVKMFLQAMALTHELLVEYDEGGRAKYNGSSPDEVTLVDAARRIGVKYLGAQHSTVHI
jgi:magnesium-transporting ATPase (P-type)